MNIPTLDNANLTVEHHGSVCLVKPKTAEAEDWLVIHTSGMWYCGALVVEPRYLEDLLVGFNEEFEGGEA
jgi:hypothetical protein